MTYIFFDRDLSRAIKCLWMMLPAKDHGKAIGIFILVFGMALLDTVGVAAIFPFMTMVANPDSIDDNEYLQNIYIYLEFSEKQEFLFWSGILLFMFMVTSLAFKAFVNYSYLKFTARQEYSLSSRLMRSYLSNCYLWFIQRNSSHLGQNILSEVSIVVNSGMNQLISLISNLFLSMLLISLIFVSNPKLALTVSLSLIAFYVVIFSTLGGFVGRLGNLRIDANKARYRIVNEAFSDLKLLKLSNLEEWWVTQYGEVCRKFANAQASSQAVGLLPRFSLEAIAFGGMTIVIIYFIETTDARSFMPTLALYGFSAYRLMPAFQQIYNNITTLKFACPAIFSVDKDLCSITESRKDDIYKPFPFQHLIELKNISFQYSLKENVVLKDINLSINKGAIVAFVGQTGSGKTTLVDIIAGLLTPTDGFVLIDGELLKKESKRSWCRQIGYVPQVINLIDDTVIANIAFGSDSNAIDVTEIRNVAKLAGIHSFIENRLPQGYQTVLGERGIRLSGGEKQRIGIARALYGSPSILIFDEATSALDNQTERQVIESIRQMDTSITVIMIAHRLSTTEECDEIFVVNKGQVVGKGTYANLLRTCDTFRDLSNTTVSEIRNA